MVINKPLPVGQLWLAGLDDTSLGSISVAVTEKALVRVLLGSQDILRQEFSATHRLIIQGNNPMLDRALEQIDEYLRGKRRQFEIQLDWSNQAPFALKVLRATYEIPYGEVITYGDVARKIGHPSAAQAVGGALGRNRIPLIIPCHRVVNTRRHLHGFSATGGLDTKAKLLRVEGHNIVDHQLV
jgi:methylated-DNA-[protein]-cysteine S-methyltransferase